jgi:protein-tyrosine phosphatase
MDFSQVTSWLYIGTTPQQEDYPTLRDLGIGLIINMRVERRPISEKHPDPIPTLWLRTFDTPLVPIPVRAFRRGTEAALQTLAQGGSVYTHCAAGVHRSAAMAACILIARGHQPDHAIALIREKRTIADPGVPYIRKRILRFAATYPNTRKTGN